MKKLGFHAAHIWIFIFSLLFSYQSPQADSDDSIAVGKFSKASLEIEIPEGWKPLNFPNIEKKT
ncbi:MAG: hypothetical protein NTV04_22085, partial [Deltaproteobacteria bacterium]|nr:hypothetical protein [Deltaproteobacteria bacterium]